MGTMGSYVLVSLQSQTCSSHCHESCITTRSPWLGMMMCSPRVRRSTSTAATAQPRYMPHLVRMCQEVANARKGGIGDNRSCCQIKWREYLDNKEGLRLGCS